jgi:ethanolamine utilization protein EutA (predicted chaperonin)
MNTILTLDIAQEAVQNAEIYANYSKKTISQLVEEYLLSISIENKVNIKKQLGPITRQLAGIIKFNKDLSPKELLADALMEKYL